MLIFASESHIIRDNCLRPTALALHGENIELTNLLIRDEESLICEYHMLHYKSSKQALYEDYVVNIAKNGGHLGILIIERGYEKRWQNYDIQVVNIAELSHSEFIELKEIIEKI